MDKIEIKNLEIYAYHGVLDEEKKTGQPFIVSAQLFVDLQPAGESDALEQTVNYAQVCDTIYETMTRQSFDLIEAAAQRVAENILLGYERVHAVRIVISKPQAPIARDFETVCVDITRCRHTVYLSIGSNMGDRKEYLDFAVAQLDEDACTTVKKVSTYIETKPYGNVEQDDFLNACLEVETLYSPQKMLEVIHEMEQRAGRERLVHWGPRTLDIDILMYDQQIVMEEHLKIPHMEMAKREFVLEPLTEIAPYAIHPIYHKSILELFELLKEKG